MRTPYSFSRNRLLTAVRFTIAGTLLCAAVAMAFVTIKSPVLTGSASQDGHRVIAKFRGDRDKIGSNKLAVPGIDRDLGPMLAAMEDYAHRAYPAKDVPMSAILNAVAGFRHVQRMSVGRRPPGSSGGWELIGPSTANVGDVLTFSGAPYVTSGRITAIAVDPSCSNRSCRVWVGAAGGGIWATDKALSG